MCFLPEDRDLCQAISLSGARGMEGSWLPDKNPSGFDQSQGNEVGSTYATNLLVCSQN